MVGQLVLTLILLCSMVTLAAAQNTPTTPEKSKQPTQQPGSTQQQDTQGWIWWDDAMGREMNITPERLRELRSMDDRYRKDYDALGATPWTSPDYRALTDRRNAEIQRLLTPEQYQNWTNRTMRDKTNTTPKTKNP
ncbi:MAG: hypothetical protein ACO1NQ_00720 [Flavobacteriales bacterium]